MVVPPSYNNDNDDSDHSGNIPAGAATDADADAEANGNRSDSVISISGYTYDDYARNYGHGQEEYNNVVARSSPSCGDKRSRSPTGSDQVRQPLKLYVTTGARPKVGDYELAVKAIIAEANILYRGHLSRRTPYPTSLEEATWAANSWEWGCKKCKTKMTYNNDMITMVSDINYSLSVLLRTYLL
jgi:hypothetical protein